MAGWLLIFGLFWFPLALGGGRSELTVGVLPLIRDSTSWSGVRPVARLSPPACVTHRQSLRLAGVSSRCWVQSEPNLFHRPLLPAPRLFDSCSGNSQIY